MQNRKKVQKKPYNQIIASFGTLVYTVIPEIKKVLILLYKRRDSFEYTEFVRALWSSMSHLKRIFSSLTSEERERIRNYTIKELWDDLWVLGYHRTQREGFTKVQKKYKTIRDIIPQLLDESKPISDSILWGFPKGKKNGHEEDSVACALREFEEETRIPSTELKVIPNISFSEIYQGTDSKTYSTEYCVAKLDNPIIINPLPLEGCIRKEAISEEAAELRWFTIEEAAEILNESKICVLEKAFKLITEIEFNESPQPNVQELHVLID